MSDLRTPPHSLLRIFSGIKYGGKSREARSREWSSTPKSAAEAQLLNIMLASVAKLCSFRKLALCRSGSIRSLTRLGSLRTPSVRVAAAAAVAVTIAAHDVAITGLTKRIFGDRRFSGKAGLLFCSCTCAAGLQSKGEASGLELRCSRPGLSLCFCLSLCLSLGFRLWLGLGLRLRLLRLCFRLLGLRLLQDGLLRPFKP